MKPMLATAVDFNLLRYPVLVSPKIDGIRCISWGGVAMSRSWKPIPNKNIQALFKQSEQLLNYMDGELVVGLPTAPNVYNTTMSGVMSEFTRPNFSYLVFDHVENIGHPYHIRYQVLAAAARALHSDCPMWVKLVQQVLCSNREELDVAEENFIAEGYEGAILRDPHAPYKEGRSTAKQGYLLKLKRYEDSEATVLGVEELLHNDNPAFTNELGRTAHTSHKENQRPGNMLGALICRTPEGQIFKIGTGFDHPARKSLWTQRESLPGKIVKYKHMPHGQLDAPRHPVFLGFRHESDM